MQAEQIIIAALIFIVFFGVIKFMARAIAIGFLIIVVAPALFANFSTDFDWKLMFERATKAVGLQSNMDLSSDVNMTLAYMPLTCGPDAPLMMMVTNGSNRDVAKVDYQLAYRASDRSTLSIFRNGTSDLIVKSNTKTEQCISMPDNAQPEDVFIAELERVRYMPM